MWLFPWNPNSDFFSQYDVGEHVTSYDNKSIWTLFKAKKKGTSQALSIFRVDSKDLNSALIERAKQSIKRIKTLRHPSILKYVDSSESEKSVCLVTEAVIPLSEYLDNSTKDYTQKQRDFSIAYGILNVAKGLDFLNSGCQLNHNNINIHTIFVNSSGLWKIGGLDYICPLGDEPPARLDELSEKYIPPERADPTKARTGPKYAVDSWGLGCLVWESFNKPVTPSSSIKTIGRMPKPLSVYYNKLVQSSPRHRVSPMNFIKECQDANVFFSTPLLETILFLDEIQLVKESSEKSKYFSRLETELESFPSDICKNKILPDLINAFEYGEAGSAILNPIFKIGKMLDSEEYQNKLVPCIIKLYACKDRATRCKLLQQLESYINYLNPTVINEQVFPQIINGFLDSNFTIREQTIKSMLHLAPKLSNTNLNDELLKHFSRLQTNDTEGGIRANTIVCLGKIAKLLNSHAQQAIAMPNFLRAFRDPFPPSRHAAIAAISANEAMFNSKDCATKIMPALCAMCIDPDVNVRRIALKSLKLFLDRIHAESESSANESATTTTSRPTTPPKSNASTTSRDSTGDVVSSNET